MPMPKGHKSKNGYATVQIDGGMGYREIAEHMTESGDEMNLVCRMAKSHL